MGNNKMDTEDKAVLGFGVGCFVLILIMALASMGFAAWVIYELVQWLTHQHFGG